MAGGSIKTVETGKTGFIQETIDNYIAVIIGMIHLYFAKNFRIASVQYICLGFRCWVKLQYLLKLLYLLEFKSQNEI